MSGTIATLPISTAAPLPDLLGQLRRALEGRSPALHPGGLEPVEVQPDTALVLPTSGSTGTPKLVELSRQALLASAHATHERVGPPGRWLLALPLTHIAGWQVLVRSVLADVEPVQLSPGPFTAAAVIRAMAAADEPVRFCSLVPTQLTRLLDDAAAVAALQRVTVLLGGAAADQSLLTRAAASGLTVVTTYGSSETSGGCVYDGRPLDGVQLRLRPDGRLMIGGPTLATGYLSATSPNPFVTEDDTRWFVTNDLAELVDGQLTILGRADDVIITGGEKVHPALVEQALLSVPGVQGAIVVGTADQQWGARIVALVQATPGAQLSEAAVREHLRRQLPAYAVPRRVHVVAEIPLLGIGKPDRRTATELAARLTE